MKLLIDTHVWLWLNASPERIAPRTLALLSDPDHERLLSAASSWEIGIKYALGRLELPEPPERYVPARMVETVTRPLLVDHAHALHAAQLPNHHRDPFDRMLVAQARLERATLVTQDRNLEPYEVEIAWA